MVSFVDAPLAGAHNNRGTEQGDFAISLIAAGKRAGYSFDELRFLRVRDLMDLLESQIGKGGDEPRAASQEDIDRLLA